MCSSQNLSEKKTFRVTQCRDEPASYSTVYGTNNTFLAEATQLGNSGLFHFPPFHCRTKVFSAHFKQAIQSAVQ